MNYTENHHKKLAAPPPQNPYENHHKPSQKGSKLTPTLTPVMKKTTTENNRWPSDANGRSQSSHHQ